MILRRVIGEDMDYYIQVVFFIAYLLLQSPNDFQESGEYVPMVHQLPDACDISAKIKLLNYVKKAIEEELD